jgi:4-amino-4-deoxy-L-arabinose transferase-like glycosyltransferase
MPAVAPEFGRGERHSVRIAAPLQGCQTVAVRVRAVSDSRRITIFWLLLALLWFLPLNSPHLFDPDEGRYAEIPREMVASGDWVTPRLDAIKYFEKPALQYWTTAIAFEVFGEHPWTVRLWPALSGFLGLLLTWALARRLYDTRTALLAVMVQASALLYIAMARIATLDMSLSFSLQLAMSALVLLARTRHRQRQPAQVAMAAVARRGRHARSTDQGIGRNSDPWSRGSPVHPDSSRLGFAAAFETLVHAGSSGSGGAPWFVLASQRNPEFAHFFFVVQHFQRYLSQHGFDRYQPAWFFVPVLAAGLLPWTTLLPGAVRAGVSAARAGERASSMLLIWAAFVFVFFSISQSKLMPYIVPMLPAVSLLTGRAITQLAPRRVRCAPDGRAAVCPGHRGSDARALVDTAGASLVARASTASIAGFVLAFVELAVGCALGVFMARRGEVVLGVAAAALGALLLAQSALVAADQLPRMRRVVDLADHVLPALDDSVRASTASMNTCNPYPSI